jgi:hypothetical protein
MGVATRINKYLLKEFPKKKEKPQDGMDVIN